MGNRRCLFGVPEEKLRETPRRVVGNAQARPSNGTGHFRR